MRILFLSRWFPYPPNNGSKLRIYNLLRGLARFNDVTLLSFTDQVHRQGSVNPELQALCREIWTVPWKPFNPNSSRSRLGFLNAKPRSVVDTFSPAMAGQIEQLLASGDYDLIIVSQIDMAVYSPYFRQCPALFEELEVGVIYERFCQATSLGQRLRNGLTWLKYRRYLDSLLPNFKFCTVVSERERQMVTQAVKSYTSIEVIPNCVDLDDYASISVKPRPNTLIFTGAFSFWPNYEAMLWFVEKVFPQVQARVPDAHLIITGDHANKPLPPANNVTLAGFVDDIRPYIASGLISLAPIWSGGGTRLKILEAMALHTPVIATSKGAEGLEVTPNEHLLIADSPELFAAATIGLLQDSKRRQQLADKAYELVCEKYNWASVIPHFLKLVERTAQS